MKKAYQIYKEYGIYELLKRIIYHIKFLNETHRLIKRTGIYKWTRYEKKTVIKKSKKIYIVTKNKYTENKTNYYFNIVDKLNKYGISINYRYLMEGTEKYNKVLPIVSLKKYDKVEDCGNEFVIVEELINNIVSAKNKIVIDEQTDENIIINKLIVGECDDFINNISIIILNYNNKGIIEKCIDSLVRFNTYNYEIIVVDNQSLDGSYEMLRAEYKDIKIVRNAKNGCSSGRNLGVKYAKNKYLLFLDSDQFVIQSKWLNCYIDILKNNQNIGAIGWAAAWFDKNGYSCQNVDNFTNRYMPPGGLYRSNIGYLGSGGCLMSKELFEKIGGFDVNYDPTCYEDTDLSLKIRNEGFELAYCPYLGIVHNPHQTTKSGSAKHEKLIQEKGNYFVKKWKKINPKLLNYVKK